MLDEKTIPRGVKFDHDEIMLANDIGEVGVIECQNKLLRLGVIGRRDRPHREGDESEEKPTRSPIHHIRWRSGRGLPRVLGQP